MNEKDDLEVMIVLCTIPPGSANSIVTELINHNLVACVNIFPVKSLYRWEGTLCDESEELLIMKTTKDKITELKRHLVSIHSYEIPEVLCIPVIDGYEGYLSWVFNEVHKENP